MTKSALITVGSTRFDGLIGQCKDIVEALAKQGYTRVVVQHGKSPLPEGLDGCVTEAFEYTDSLSKYIEQSDIVISHAGACTGTVIEVLRSNKKLVVVHNEKLLDDHQKELAVRLSRLGYCVHSSVENLLSTLHATDLDKVSPAAFPEFAADRVRRFFDGQAGFPV
ncbi:hypothetical protein E3P99_02682 [Wallemia hederae]|uniref:UDP-N-acetylglucosamine transferase subunit ALG13 n=1 Tax=Wallemia hederae TaxID=1540922 RepID=A0A4T0FJC7_9BASI|nr:hypothetical protein E3P99_02682 [Wallemia hederae]